MPKLTDRNVFYKLCQHVVDNMVEKDIHLLKYGESFGPVKAQHMSAVIEILRQYGAVEPSETPNVFQTVSPIYRLYYTREFEMLNKEYCREQLRDKVNVALAFLALASAVFSGILAFK